MDWGAKYQRYMSLDVPEKKRKRQEQLEAIQYETDDERQAQESGNDTAAMRRFTPRQEDHVRQMKKKRRKLGKAPKV